MPNFLAAAEALISVFRGSLGEQITVVFGEETTPPFFATITEERPIDEVTGEPIHWHGIAIQFDVADLKFNGVVKEPVIGMRVQRTIGGSDLTYQVAPPSPNEEHFAYFPARTRAVMYATEGVI